MGIHGLTTFIQKYHDKHKEKIYLTDCPVVIDGCNLMYFLYFQARQTLPSGSTGSTPNRNSSPLSKVSPLKQPHLFGGDYLSYAQSVREFFQHLKLCGITPIVIFDGAYDDLKIKTALRRFAENIKENVRSVGNNLKGVTPGSSYAPAFMKAVFLEILQEQKIPHYQTEQEADCTIAFIARKLGNCAILSSDSDFHIYINAVVLPLHTLRFKKVVPTKNNKGKMSTISDATKIWTLHSQYVSLRNLCKKEFNLNDARLLPLAAVILGNDWIKTATFSNFHSTTGGGGRVARNFRIAYLLKWLGKQKSYSRVVKVMLSTVKESQRERTLKLVNEIVAVYDGLGGEERVWKILVDSGKIPEKFISHEDISEMLDTLCLDDSTTSSLVEDNVIESTDFSLDDTIIDDEDTTEDNGESDSETEEEKLETREEMFNRQLQLPDWYLDAHIKCCLPTYLLKLIRNRMVLLPPQAEISTLKSTHSMSTPIIQVLGGILLGESVPITLLSRQKSKVVEVSIETVTELKIFGKLPLFSKNCQDFRKTLSPEARSQIILETLDLYSPEFVSFVNEWPVSLRIWAICLVYFIKSNSAISEDEAEDLNMQLVRTCSKPVAISILLSVIKNSVLSPSGSSKGSSSKISDLLNQPDQQNISKLRNFYASNEAVLDTSSRNFTRSYEIIRTYNISRFTCTLFHLHQLNRLLGDPFRAPRLNCNMNNWFVYNLTGKLEKENNIQELCDVNDIALIVDKLLSFA